ncbi:hypothetical protein NM208_g1628 [Fusarium decemcellulare]|uniref:Uncharacterized protein n=1 Tax=Fusarium decemcellulare TaxID=57161 RepID=A0ACC1SVG4_9HYPO|nr:hypothetical protein NM208_g1628 [Fusarium decemcellulare]
MEHPSASSGWTEDPWRDAFKRLPAASQALLTQARQSDGITSAEINTANIVKETIEIVKQKKSDSHSKEWTFKIGGKEIEPRHLFDRIIDWLQKFIAIGDVAVAFDPVHAALPWAASAVLNREQTQGILQIIEKVTYLVQQGRFYEATYNPTTMNLLDKSGTTWLSDLWKDLVGLYEVILTSLVYACRKLEQPTSRRVLGSIFKPEDIQNHISSLKDHGERLEKRADVCHKAHSQQVLNKLLESCEEANHKIADAALDYVSNIPFRSHHEFVQRLRTPDTCGWILETDNYQDWKKWIFKVAILYGPPGAGKTFLISRVIDDLKLPSEPEASAHSVAYFYCNRNEVDRTKPENVLLSYVRQLAMPRGRSSILKDILRLKGDLSREGRRLDLFRARELLMQLIDAYATTTLVLDAMDECDPESRQDLLDTLDHIVKQKYPAVRLFISSRRDADIRRHFEDRPKIEVEASCSQHDIGVFVEMKLQGVKNFQSRSPELRQLIKKTLMAKNEGMFQWVALQLDQLSRCLTNKEMEDRLGRLPGGLTATYQEIWSQILQSPYRRDKVPRVIQWIMASKGRLTTELLAEIMEVDPASDAPDSADEELANVAVISDIFYNLLINDVGDCWRFCHLSAREYFEEHHYSFRHANAFVGACCLKWLAIPLEPSPRLSSMFYASKHWFQHLRAMDDVEENATQRVRYLLKMFLGSFSTGSPSFNYWLEVFGSKLGVTIFHEHRSAWIQPRLGFCYGGDIGGAPILTACHLIPDHLLSDWWQEAEFDLNMCGPNGMSLLELSLRGGTLVWKYFLRRNVLVDNGSTTPLKAAIEIGNTEAIDALLAAGADVNRRAQDDRRTCLFEAIIRRDGETVRKLVNHGADINKAEVDESRWSVAHALLDLGARTSLKDLGTTIIKMARTQESTNLLRRFLDMGETLPPLGKSLALKPREMSLEEETEAVQTLIDLGAGVDDTDNGESPGALAAAVSSRFNILIVKVLLDNGANMDLITDHEQEESALCAAAYRRRNDALQFLLGAGADPNQGTDYVTPLIRCFPFYWDHGESARLLLDAGAQVNAICSEGRYPTALIAACSTDDRKDVELLIEWGADVNLSFEWAIKRGDDWVVEILLENGADPNYSYSEGTSSPLATAAYNGHFEVTKLLLEAGASPNHLLSGWFKNAIQAALRGVTKLWPEEDTESWSDDAKSDETASWSDAIDLSHRSRWLRFGDSESDETEPWSEDTHLDHSGLRVIELLLQHGAEPPMPLLKSPELPASFFQPRSGQALAIHSAFGSHNLPIGKLVTYLPPIWAAIFLELTSAMPCSLRRLLEYWSFPCSLPSFYILMIKLDQGQKSKIRPSSRYIVITNSRRQKTHKHNKSIDPNTDNKIEGS